MLPLMAAIYRVLIPVSVLSYMRQQRAWEARMADAQVTTQAAAADDRLAELDRS